MFNGCVKVCFTAPNTSQMTSCDIIDIDIVELSVICIHMSMFMYVDNTAAAAASFIGGMLLSSYYY